MASAIVLRVPEIEDSNTDTTVENSSAEHSSGLLAIQKPDDSVSPTANTNMAVGSSSAKDGSDILSLPEPGDSCFVLLSKLSALAETVLCGKSIAVATNFVAVPHEEKTATQKAVDRMTQLERESWQAYSENRYPLPTINWSSDRKPVPTSGEPLSAPPLRTARRRAEALNSLYKTDQATPAHAFWFSENHLVHLPLVKAMVRVIGAEKVLFGGQGVLTATQMADLQTLNKLFSVSAEITRKKGNGSTFLGGIDKMQRVLSLERERLRTLLRGREKKRKECDVLLLGRKMKIQRQSEALLGEGMKKRRHSV